jgi:zinc protease
MLDLSAFPAGAGYDRPETAGVASMTNRMLQLGADGMSEDEIARRLADVGAQLGGRFSTDHAGLAVRTLVSAKERRQALDIFARVLSRPEFPREVLDREKVRLIGALKEADTTRHHAASPSTACSPRPPAALRASGEVATVEKIRVNLAAFHQRITSRGTGSCAGRRRVARRGQRLPRRHARLPQGGGRGTAAGRPSSPPLPACHCASGLARIS